MSIGIINLNEDVCKITISLMHRIEEASCSAYIQTTSSSNAVDVGVTEIPA